MNGRLVYFDELNALRLLYDQILGDGFGVEAVQNHDSLPYRSSEYAGILDHCRDQCIRFFAYMVLEQGALTGKYHPENPLPEGSSRAKIYNGALAQIEGPDGQARLDRPEPVCSNGRCRESLGHREGYNADHRRRSGGASS